MSRPAPAVVEGLIDLITTCPTGMPVRVWEIRSRKPARPGTRTRWRIDTATRWACLSRKYKRCCGKA